MFIPQYRRKVWYGQLRQEVGEVLRELARQKESRIEEGQLQPDPVPRLRSIPPKSAVAQVGGDVKGKRAIYIARPYGGRLRNFLGEHVWARGDVVSPVGRDEEAVRQYMRAQEAEERRLEQRELFNKKKK